MLRSIDELSGYPVIARDGKIGKVSHFFFDDRNRQWTVRYLIVAVGNFLMRKEVLVSPESFLQPTPVEFPVNLTKKQIENSPDIDTAKPVSRQMEEALHDHYGWPTYWTAPAYMGHVPVHTPLSPSPTKGNGDPLREKSVTDELKDPNLRSTKEVIGYHLHALDGDIGHVRDMIVDDEAWVIRYLVINTKNWLPGKDVILPPSWAEKISWKESTVHINITKKVVKECPEFDPAAPVNRVYEENLYDYYGRQKYWVR